MPVWKPEKFKDERMVCGYWPMSTTPYLDLSFIGPLHWFLSVILTSCMKRQKSSSISSGWHVALCQPLGMALKIPPSWDIVSLHFELEELGFFSEILPTACIVIRRLLAFLTYKRDWHKFLCLPNKAVVKLGKEVVYKLSTLSAQTFVTQGEGPGNTEHKIRYVLLFTHGLPHHLLSSIWPVPQSDAVDCWLGQEQGLSKSCGFLSPKPWHYLLALQRKAWNHRATRKAVQSEVREDLPIKHQWVVGRQEIDEAETSFWEWDHDPARWPSSEAVPGWSRAVGK